MKAESITPMPAPPAKKIAYLEGIRGVAALQVVLVHFLLMFLPAQQCSRFWFCWAQALRKYYFFFPVDGYMAVSLFFILSGYVLTKSFARTSDKPVRNIFKRWVRLQIPAFFALALAFVLISLCGDAFTKAAQLNGTADWAKGFFTTPPTFVNFLKESFWVSLLAGYKNISVFTGFGGYFFPGEQSLDVPLWSLNIEFWGSMLIIALAWLRPKSAAHDFFLILGFGMFFLNSLVLFLIGHVLAGIAAKENPLPSVRAIKIRNSVGIALVILGILLSTWREDLIPDDLFVAIDSLALFPAQSSFHYVGMVAAIFIFVGIFTAPCLRALFGLRPLQKLGRISFALYLLHFPILLTVTAVLEIRLVGFFGYSTGAVLSFIFGLAFTFAAAAFFTRWIDEPAVRLSRYIGNQTGVCPVAKTTAGR